MKRYFLIFSADRKSCQPVQAYDMFIVTFRNIRFWPRAILCHFVRFQSSPGIAVRFSPRRPCPAAVRQYSVEDDRILPRDG
jgi:hypothetical protein